MTEMTNTCIEKDYSDLESRSDALGWDLGELLDEDEDFRKDILYFITETGSSFDQICFGVIGLAQYYLERVRPDRCGTANFYDYWIEPAEYHPMMIKTVDYALERVRNKIEAMELENSNERSLR